MQRDYETNCETLLRPGYRLFNGDVDVGGPLLECRGFLQKGIGFMGHARPKDGHGFWFGATGSLHTWFMRFDLDIIFLDADNRVVRIREKVSPWRFVLGGRGAVLAVEAPCGSLDLSRIALGDTLRLAVAD